MFLLKLYLVVNLYKLLRTTNDWLVDMDKGLINGVVFLGLKKAFDTVDHDILIKNLEFYDIKNNALPWFISYLSNRKQVCKVGMSMSNSETLAEISDTVVFSL